MSAHRADISAFSPIDRFLIYLYEVHGGGHPENGTAMCIPSVYKEPGADTAEDAADQHPCPVLGVLPVPRSAALSHRQDKKDQRQDGKDVLGGHFEEDYMRARSRC